MKTRLISALLGIIILIAVLLFYNTLVLNAAVAIIGMIGVYELLYATRYLRHPYLLCVSLVFVFVVAFLNQTPLKDQWFLVVTGLFFLYLLPLFFQHEKLMFPQISTCFMVTLLVSFSLSTIVFVRDCYPREGFYYLSLIFICAWVTDGGAYFAGRLFGKHKLAKKISPKKTIEGAIGGIFFCIVCCFAYSYIYISAFANSSTDHAQSNLLLLICLALLGSLVGISGDLFASIIKRQSAIKDFGNLMPGHGGVLDRFDSVLFIAPFIYLFVQFFPILTFAKTIAN